MSKRLDVRLVPAALAAWGCAAMLAPAGARAAAVVAVGALVLGMILAAVLVRAGRSGFGALAAVTLAVAAAVAASAAIATVRASSSLAGLTPPSPTMT